MINLFEGNFGLEREAVRISKMAEISNTEHPLVFDETNPYITKDFGEAQVEMITPACTTIDDSINLLEDIQQVVMENLEGRDLLWKQSNPPIINKDNGVMLAKFDSDPDKEQYRKYLSNKYGIEKSIISGIHFNFSFSDEILKTLYEKRKDEYDNFTQFKNTQYLKVAKYILKNRWYFIYLTNASPVFHNSYYDHCVNISNQLNTGDCIIDGLNSLRNSNCGYRNKEDIILDFTSWEDYQNSIKQSIESGQITGASELYTPVRLKENDSKNIEYIELRFIDINPFTVSGVSDIDLKYLHLHMIYALFNEDFDFDEESQIISNNKHNMASRNDNSKDFKQSMIQLHNEVINFFKDKSSIYNLTEIFESVNERINDNKHTYAERLKEKYQQSSYIDYHLEQAIRDKRYSENNLFTLASDNSLELSTKILIKEAIKEGYMFEILDSPSNFITLTDLKSNNTQFIQQATKTNLDHYANVLAMENKVVTKKLLSKNNINNPSGYELSNVDQLDTFDLSIFENDGVVIKPNTTNFGEGITIFPEGATFEQIKSAAEFAFSKDSTILIEKFIKGNEYRFLVIGQKVNSVLHRRAANVIGDGKSTIEQLVKEKNNSSLRGYNYVSPLEKIMLGEKEIEFLKLQNLTVNSILDDQEIVYLRENSNISTGGDSIDYTDLVDESYIKIAEEAARALHVNISGVDMIIDDPTVKANNFNYSILELNFNPAIHIHTYPLIGENRNPAKAILDELFKK